MVRNPMFALGTVGFPIMFFGLFGLPAVKETTSGGANVGQIILVSFGTHSLLSLAMFSFGSAVATERRGGWLRLLRASPMPTALYFAGKVIAALLFSALALSLLYAFAHFAGGVTLPLGLALTLLVKLLAGMVSLIAVGLSIGFLANPQSAQILANIVSVIVAFASGLFVPLDGLPAFMQRVAPYLPSYHLARLGWGTLAGQGGAGQTGGEVTHWLWLAGYTLVFGALAIWALRRDEARGQ
ncbi:ABC transporter [Deinococcus aetherius]|uniref:ABC transporter n=2 Tax=Deinococcus aetherius TaxID=200252 RepID=A0ABM8AFV1_9DEIO|nr:ABC transporter [Deinococcus aetherius]